MSEPSPATIRQYNFGGYKTTLFHASSPDDELPDASTLHIPIFKAHQERQHQQDLQRPQPVLRVPSDMNMYRPPESPSPTGYVDLRPDGYAPSQRPGPVTQFEAAFDPLPASLEVDLRPDGYAPSQHPGPVTQFEAACEDGLVLHQSAPGPQRQLNPLQLCTNTVSKAAEIDLSADSPKKGSTKREGTNERVHFDGALMYRLAETVKQDIPYWDKHGQMGKHWQRIAEKTVAGGAPGIQGLTGHTAKAKHDAMLDFHRHPEGKNKRLAKHIGPETAFGTMITAVLHSLCDSEDRAKNMKDDKKQAVKKKLDQDQAAGASLRDASLKTMSCTGSTAAGKRRRSPSSSPEPGLPKIEPGLPKPESANDSDGDTTEPDEATQADPSTSRSIIDLTDERPAVKRRRVSERRANTNEQILAHLNKAEERRERHEQKMEEHFESFAQASLQQRDKMLSVLQTAFGARDE
ncbi:hypothetical protein MKEN_00390100 [Mycena kentingensis (nom. inval.)]|nr:hypothetical protein MKEN_00390100 [Mycena kentingensis (nom. inval.)]